MVFPSPNSFQMLPTTSPPYPPPPANFMFSLSKNKWKMKIKTKPQKPSKTKKNAKTKQKTPPHTYTHPCTHARTHKVHFVLAYSWEWTLTWSVLNIPSDTPLEETDCIFASTYQLQGASWLGMGPRVHSPFSVLEHYLAWTCASPMSGTTASVSLYVYQSCCVWKAVFLESSTITSTF